MHTRHVHLAIYVFFLLVTKHGGCLGSSFKKKKILSFFNNAY